MREPLIETPELYEIDSAPQTTTRRAISWALVAALLFVLATATFFMLLSRELSGLNQADLLGLTWAYHSRGPTWDPLMTLLTEICTAPGFAAQLLVVAWLLARQPQGERRRDLLLILLALVGGVMLNQLLKASYQRVRPDIYPGPYNLTDYSFPSGHAMAATCFYGALALIAVRRLRQRAQRWAAILLAILLVVGIGLSRVYFAVHYPTDVIGGTIAGLAWLVTTVLILRGAQTTVLR